MKAGNKKKHSFHLKPCSLKRFGVRLAAAQIKEHQQARKVNGYELKKIVTNAKVT